ncbi:MAG: Tim44/TimA family putative adaptor protein [Solirubrobacterales bacterium]
MNDGFHFIDIIFFAMVAAFLVLRLRSVLGRRTGNERPPQQIGDAPGRPSDNVIDLASARKPAGEAWPEGAVGAGLAAIRAADPAFSPEQFVSGARAAFGMIVEAYAHGDKPVLKPLLSDEVYRGFAEAIDGRQSAGEVLETELISIRAADIVEAGMERHLASVTVRFRSDQVNVVRDAQGRIVDGDPDRVADVTDEWTFRRDTRSPDPNWQLVATRAPADQHH